MLEQFNNPESGNEDSDQKIDIVSSSLGVSSVTRNVVLRIFPILVGLGGFACGDPAKNGGNTFTTQEIAETPRKTPSIDLSLVINYPPDNTHVFGIFLNGLERSANFTVTPLDLSCDEITVNFPDDASDIKGSHALLNGTFRNEDGSPAVVTEFFVTATDSETGENIPIDMPKPANGIHGWPNFWK
jgi:hypothetical protein